MRMLSVFAGAVLVAAATSTQATVVDFESVPGIQFASEIDADGFSFDFNADGWFIGDPSLAVCLSCADNGTNILGAAGDRDGIPARVEVTQIGGAAFDIVGFDAATLNTRAFNTLGYTADLLGGGTAIGSFDIDGVFETFALGLQDVLSITFFSGSSGSYNTEGFALDNIDTNRISVVPVPASLPLLLAGLGGLGLASRRRKAA